MEDTASIKGTIMEDGSGGDDTGKKRQIIKRDYSPVDDVAPDDEEDHPSRGGYGIDNIDDDGGGNDDDDDDDGAVTEKPKKLLRKEEDAVAAVVTASATATSSSSVASNSVVGTETSMVVKTSFKSTPSIAATTTTTTAMRSAEPPPPPPTSASGSASSVQKKETERDLGNKYEEEPTTREKLSLKNPEHFSKGEEEECSNDTDSKNPATFEKATTTIRRPGGRSDDYSPPKSPSASSPSTATTTGSTARQHIGSVPSSRTANNESSLGDGGQDLESALSSLVGCTTSNEGQREREKKEYISQHCYLTFRMGHAGDASRIANWYREEKKKKGIPAASESSESSCEEPHTTIKEVENNDPTATRTSTEEEGDDENCEDQEPLLPSTKETEGTSGTENTETRRTANVAACSVSSTTVDQESASSLELWLADGLGDEDMPPSLFALLVHVNYDKISDNKDESENEPDEDAGSTKSSSLAAVALLTVSWEHSERVLRIEWLRVDSDLGEKASLVEKRTWLRLAALSLMTNCEMHVVDQTTSLTKQSTS